MGPRIVRTLTALVAGGLLAFGTAPAVHGEPIGGASISAPARPAPTKSAPARQVAELTVVARDHCSPNDANSVTVVVDFGPLGGVDIRCASLWPGATAADAMSAVGFSTVGTQSDGPGFVCRINGEPASELCVQTPPTSAYWSYWKASPAGGWGYSSSGFLSSRVKLGGFEGWSFGSGGAPGVDPVHPAAPEPAPEPEPEPEPEHQAPEAPAPEPGQPAAPAPAPEAAAPDEGSPDAAGDEGSADSADSGPVATAAGSASAGVPGSTDTTNAAAPTESSAVGSSAGSTLIAVLSIAGGSSGSSAATSSGGATPLAADETSSGSTVWISVVALAAVAGLGGAAVLISRRRSRLPTDRDG